jgi:hypothetical protein
LKNRGMKGTSNMGNIVRSSTFWGGLIVLGLFVLPAIFVPRQEFFEVLNAVLFSVGTGIVWAYRKEILESLKQPLGELSGGQILQLGIVLGWASSAIMFAILWYWRLTGRDLEVVDSMLNAFSRWVLILAGMLHLAAAGAIEGRVPGAAYVRSGKIVAFGMIFGTLLITYFGLPVQSR